MKSSNRKSIKIKNTNQKSKKDEKYFSKEHENEES